MAICRLMIEAFMHGDSRFPECFNYQEAYNNGNLEDGICYAKWLLEDGFEKEPFYKFDLRKFIKWAQKELKKKHPQS